MQKCNVTNGVTLEICNEIINVENDVVRSANANNNAVLHCVAVSKS